MNVANFKRSILVFLLCLFTITHLEARVYISEFLAENDSGLRDEDGDREDWVELSNAADRGIDLGGFFLTDDPDDPRQWAFPSVTLEPGEKLIVFCSGKDRRPDTGELHTNFKLNNKGEYLALVGPDGSDPVHEFRPSYPRQRADVSYGLTDASSEAVFFHPPTPGQANAAVTLGSVDRIKFSHTRGFHEEPFQLSLSCEADGVEMRYTLDGTIPTEDNGVVYREPIPITRCTVIRAAAFKLGYKTRSPETHSYLFTEDILNQSPDGSAPEGWPERWGRNRVDYGMDPLIVNDPRYREEIVAGLKSIPAYSLVMNLEDLLSADRGIYANASQSGRAWERACSMELLNPDRSEGFQIDCGIRIRGGFSRMGRNPKHAFRLFFRKDYGPGKLRYPLFGEDGVQEFDNLDLRTFQNYSWSLGGEPNALFMRDVFSRDTQLDMGQPGARGYYCHLFINGQYWGLYNTCERPEASYGASYLGGDKEDFDVIKIQGRGSYYIFATDGNEDAWRELWELADEGFEDPANYQRALGNHPDGSPNPEMEKLLDPENLIDYMLIIFYAGNRDSPTGIFSGDQSPNNFYSLRGRGGDHGFQHIIWDAEHTLLDIFEDRTGPFTAGQDFSTSNPRWLWQQCLDNPEFRLLVADRIRKHFFNGGVLTPEACRERLLKRALELDVAVIAESARWGDTGGGRRWRGRNVESLNGPLNRNDHWLPEVARVMETYFPERSRIVLDQLWSHGLIPDTAPPALNLEGEPVPRGFELQMSSRVGEIYFSLDGTDPRELGGGVSAAAQKYSAAIPLSRDAWIKARVNFGGEWSALTEARIEVE